MKLIKVSDLREVNDQYLREEITFSMYCEILNEIANKKLSEELSKRMPEMINHLMDYENIKTYHKFPSWSDKQIADACMKSFLQIDPIKP